VNEIDPRQRLVSVQLDEKTFVRRKPEVEHERATAIYDLLDDNYFRPLDGGVGPYSLCLSLADNRLVFDILGTDGHVVKDVVLGIIPFRAIVRDYFLICESYYASIRRSLPSQIEAIDMARRGLHNEGARLLKERLSDKVEVDMGTARRLFTLVCVLHIRG
jgi:uncharacterized protein (UPF0262 family)